MKNNILNTLTATALTLLMAVVATPHRADAQSTFVLTNGSYKVTLNEVTLGLNNGTDLAIGHRNGRLSLEKFVGAIGDTTYSTAIGSVYVALDTTGSTGRNNGNGTLTATTSLNPFCFWTRSGTTGKYYQEWAGKRYYLVSPVANHVPTLGVLKVGEYDNFEIQSDWYDWDNGVAWDYEYVRPGSDSKAHDYFWLMYDETEDEWTMSCNSYERPETEIYATDRLSLVNYDSFYCAIHTADPHTNTKAGQGALFSAVTEEHHAKWIDEDALDESGYGFTAVTVDGGTAQAPYTTLQYGEYTYVTPLVNFPGGGVTVDTVTAYIVDTIETGRRGINLNWRNRTSQTLGSAGVASTPIISYRYMGGVHNAEPSVGHGRGSAQLTPASVLDTVVSLDPRARRYASVVYEPATTGEGAHPGRYKVECIALPGKDMTAELTITVFYEHGLSQSKTQTITLSGQEYPALADKTPEKGPVILGFVVGGGRIANVGHDAGNYSTNTITGGNTWINIHSCDTVYAVYGGNDIAGWVQGSATIHIGSEYTNADHPVKIGYLYGGGCGYYAYENAYDALAFYDSLTNGHTVAEATATAWDGSGVLSPNLSYGHYCFSGNVYPWKTTAADLSGEHPVAPVATGFTYHPYDGSGDFNFCEKGQAGNGTVPYIKSSHIIVGVEEPNDNNHNDALGHDAHTHNDYIRIDSLFGGAENAFIGIQASDGDRLNGTTIDIHGGTIFSVFGGNNYGGSVANTATVLVNVYGTKIPADMTTVCSTFGGNDVLDKTINNTFYTGYGRDFGIRYLFGGGNLVEGSHAEVTIRGGMVDTCFLGGNRATVNRPIGTVNCTGIHYVFENDSVNWEYEAGNWVRKDLSDPTDYANLINHSPGRYNQEMGRYNVRCIFGGNNQAPMQTLSTLNLLSGGVSFAYGGGNAGDMRFDKPFAETNPATGLPWVPIIASGISTCLDGWEFEQPTVISSIIKAPIGSKIMVESIYGGCRMANVKGSSVLWLSGGTFGYVQGGNDISGDVGSEMSTHEGTWTVLDNDALVLQDVYGGSDGYYHCQENGMYIATEPNEITDYNEEPYDPYDEYVGMLVPTHNHTNLYIHGATVLFSAYGGGVMTNTGFNGTAQIYLRDSANVTNARYTKGVRRLNVNGGVRNGSIHFMINGGTIGSATHHGDGYGDGNAYAGGYLSGTYGLGYAKIKGTSIIHGSLYAGNDCMGTIQNFGAYSIGATASTPVAASAMAASDGTPLNTEKPDKPGEYDANFSSYVLIEGTPQIGSVYGSGNGAYDYDGSRPEYSNLEPVCWDQMSRMYGNPRPEQASVFVDIHTEGLHPVTGRGIDTVFGGGNGVGVSGAVTVLLNTVNNDAQYVNTIFGGNNRDKMSSTVPEIWLTKGQVGDVYGGGNAGNMEALTTKPALCGDEVENVSTYVLVNSEDMTVNGSIYGGCNQADVKGLAYIDIRETSASGVNHVFGGNNVSGSVNGNTRIDVWGGKVNNIHGGSNGKYEYQQMGNGEWLVFPYGSTHAERVANEGSADTLSFHSTGSPTVSSTLVNIFGGTIDNDVFGGGMMGDCDETHVVVNDTVCGRDPASTGATINGVVYGGGEGNHLDLNATHRGNVTANAYVDLYHAQSLTGAKAYGGGKGGDVYNTYLTIHPAWEQPFDDLYGGCWGSDVLGTAHLTLDGKETPGAYNALRVFGGNDRTGNVYKSEVNINSGRYGFVYGAGDGNFSSSNAAWYNTGVYATEHRYVPNNENVVVNVNGGIIDSNLYGGGKLGTAFSYQKDANGEYVLVNGKKVADTSNTTATAFTNCPKAENYASIIVNVHDGQFNQNIYSGAAGAVNGNWLVYGVKILNMNGGTVRESVYGGSENVSDGYKHECTGSNRTTETTMRPSSILNITGGNIQKNVYGGGYLGNVYGSVYINIGINAIDTCPIWTKNFGSDSTYYLFKPDRKVYRVTAPSDTAWGYSPALDSSNLAIGISVYGGANWGNNTGGSDFTVRGYYGGESRIIVDGLGYKSLNSGSDLRPTIDIERNLIGSGTSAKGGDIYNLIEVHNYGVIDPTTCRASKTLLSIQRADALWLHNTAIEYTGATDAASSFPSQNYTINRVDTVNMRGFNLVELNATMTNIKEMAFYENDRAVAEPHNFVPVDRSALNVNAQTNRTTYPDPCTESATRCELLEVVNATDRKYSALLINNGVNVDILYEDGGHIYYGPVIGYGYALAEATTSAIITARFKLPDGDDDHHTNDGGFSSTCFDRNKKPTVSAGDLSWDVCSSDCNNNVEYTYTNYGNSYRVWTSGDGLRRRYATLLANATPNDPSMEGIDKRIKVDGKDLCLAKTQLLLPPTTAGHYYKLVTGSFQLQGDNENVNLIDSAWYPATGTPFVSRWGALPDNWTDDAESYCTLMHAPLDAGGTPQGIQAILNKPASTFGLFMATADNFDDNRMPTHASGTAKPYTVITGNSHVNYSVDYCSSEVTGDNNVSPTMDLYLTYSNTFANTFLGTVTFRFDEFYTDGEGNEVDAGAPIEVQVIISTIINEFTDMKYELLAMYNEGRSNHFVRKVVLPATLQHRNLYMTSVKWLPTDMNGGDSLVSDKFYLAENEERVTGFNEGPNPHDTVNRFCVNIRPADNISSSLESAIGWHNIDEAEVNLFSLTTSREPHNSVESKYSWYHDGDADSVVLRDDPSHFGLKIGELDGRGLAVLNVDLTFDGNRVYEARPGKGYVGKLVVGLESRIGTRLVGETFYLTLYVKTRAHGDTIYVASADYVDRGDKICYPYHASRTSLSESDPQYCIPEDEGKTPNTYVRTFQDALSTRVYNEGDVIAILDKVTIDDASVTIMGEEYATIPVIRYTGHHRQMPGEEGVYRGPMIEIDHGGILNAYCIAFDGGAIGKVTPVVSGITQSSKVDDTNRVFGPIFQLKNNSSLLLSKGTTVMHNWNDYSTSSAASDTTLRGTINLTGKSTLVLQYNVDIAENYNHNFASSMPRNGAVYINDGVLSLPSTNENSAITIINNYLMPTMNDAGSRTIPAWCDYYPNEANAVRWMIDTNVTKLWQKANVFLTRTAGSPNAITQDAQSDTIILTNPLATNTRIGITKWFPGPTERDTIRFAHSKSETILQDAVKNFISDAGDNVFFNRNVNTNTLYLHRCATFKQQEDGETLLSHLATPLHIATGDVLTYIPLVDATCPTGGDTIIYRVQGGFFPYTYTWSNAQDKVRTTYYANSDIMKQLAAGNNSGFKDAIADTLVTAAVAMAQTEASKVVTYQVSANDITGFCELRKNIQVTLIKDVTGGVITKWQQEDPVENWTSTEAHDEAVVTAYGTRRFPAVKITPKVWSDRNYGTINAMVSDPYHDTIYTDIADNSHIIANMSFCEGDILHLGAATRRDGSGEPVSDFIMWSFDPYYNNPVTYVVPAQNTEIIAYFGPKDYWKDVINTTAKAGSVYDDNNFYTTRPTLGDAEYTSTDGSHKSGYVTTYNGDVHIYDENGLAWFISVVNGLNGTQARSFYFNNVFLHKKSNGEDYDMKDHKWTPVGTIQHRFRGNFIGVEGKDRNGDDLPVAQQDSCTTPAITPLVIKNIIVDEPYLENAGFFAWLDSAYIRSIELQSALVRGSQYVGTMAARSVNSKIDHCIVNNCDEGDITTTILTTHHTSGGMLGRSNNDTISECEVNAKYVGDAVYSGGVVGYIENKAAIINTSGRNLNYMEGLYLGGIAGWCEGTAPYNGGAKSNNGYARIQNNYMHLITDGRSQRVGGLVGYATNSLIENNYVHGTIIGSATEGGVGAVLDNGSFSEHNYYEQKAVGTPAGQLRGNAVARENTDFHGEGNQVQLGTNTYGVNNLTRVLNLWVREHGDEYRTWRSDLTETNHGYPLFGEPDLIPVHDEFTYEACDSMEWEGTLYTETTVLNSHVIDSLMMIDSTATFNLLIHHSVNQQYSDTVDAGQPYSGYGFELSATETRLLSDPSLRQQPVTIILTDTLVTVTGCDSVVTLALTLTPTMSIISAAPSQIKVYPNPALSHVTVEATGLSHVELFDTEGRRLKDYLATDGDAMTIDVNALPTGAYYLRIHNSEGVTIQKLIKQ